MAPRVLHAPVRRSGFTLIELMVVMAVLALLASIVVPRYFQHTDHAKEAVLRANLQEVRRAIDHFYADTGRYPDTLDALVQQHYLLRRPVDPITDRADTWVAIPPKDPETGKVFDVRSGAPGQARDGSAYASW